MAACVLLQSTAVSGQPSAARVVNGVSSFDPLAWFVSEAGLVNGVYSCPVGSHILLTPSEASQATNMTAQDGLTVGWSIAAIWLGVWALTFIGRIIRDGSNNESNES
jgi:hypothetical protein